METGYSFPRSLPNEDEIPLPRRAAFFADVEYMDNTYCRSYYHVFMSVNSHIMCNVIYLIYVLLYIHDMPMYILQSDTHVQVCYILCNPSMNTMLTVCWPNALIVVLYDSWPVGF